MYTETAYPVIDLVETGHCIERQRRMAGLTVRDLQAYFGFEYPQAIYKWQHGECLPSVDNLLALARVLRVPMEDLLVYEDREVRHFGVLRARKTARWAVFSEERAGRPRGVFLQRLLSSCCGPGSFICFGSFAPGKQPDGLFSGLTEAQ